MYSTCLNRKGPSEAQKQTRPGSYATALIHSEHNDEIHMTEKNDNNTNNLIKTRTPVTKDGPYPTTSRDVLYTRDNVVQQRDEQDTIHIDPIQMDIVPHDTLNTQEEHREKMVIETETMTTKQTGTQNEKQQQVNAVLHDKKTEMNQELALEKEEEGEEGGKDLTADERQMEEDDTPIQDKDVSPKRTKKMRMDKHMTRTQDRSRSATRRGATRGKVQ